MADLDVAADQGKKVLGKIMISGAQCTGIIALPFKLDHTARQLECRLGVKGKADVTVSAMRIVRE